MNCHDCGAEVAADAATCPSCGTTIDADGGDPVGDGGEPTDAGTPGQQTVGGGQTGQGGQSAGAPGTAAGRRGGLADRFRESLADLPVAPGAVFGVASLAIPFALIAAASLFAVGSDPLEVAASLFFVIVAFESGELFVRTFAREAGIAPLRAVDPSDYPSVEDKLANALDLLLSNPDAALLLLYLVFPVVLYVGGRYLARNYALEGDVVDHVTTGGAVVVGTLPVAVLVGVAFGVDDLVGRLLFVGLVVPAAIGALGGLTVFLLDDDAAFTSRIVGWLGVAAGLAVTFLLYTPQSQRVQDELSGPAAEQIAEALSLTVQQKFVHSAMAYLATVQFNVGFGDEGLPVFFGVVLATVLAGFLRAYLDRDAIATREGAARMGARIVLGYATALLLLAVVLPLSMVFVTMPFGVNGLAAQVLPAAGDLLPLLLLGGVLFPAVFGAAGGYLTAVYLERQGRPMR